MRSNLSFIICFTGCALLVFYKIVLLDSGLSQDFIQWNKIGGVVLTVIGASWLFLQFCFETYQRYIKPKTTEE